MVARRSLALSKYTEQVVAATPYRQTSKHDRVTGVQPQLLNAIDEDQSQHLLLDPAWRAQEQLDEKRVLIRRRLNKAIGINRQDLITHRNCIG